MKERISLNDLYECNVECPRHGNHLVQCDNKRCINYGSCQTCKHYHEYTTYCEKKCIFMNHHKGFATTDMTEVEFKGNPQVRELIKKTHKGVVYNYGDTIDED